MVDSIGFNRICDVSQNAVKVVERTFVTATVDEVSVAFLGFRDTDAQ
jgi:hypothetical protein